MLDTTPSNPSDLWMPLFGIETDRARAAQLRGMLANVPWELAQQLYGGRLRMQARVEQMTEELQALERRIQEEERKTGQEGAGAPGDSDGD
jgi:hypothetical protein